MCLPDGRIWSYAMLGQTSPTPISSTLGWKIKCDWESAIKIENFVGKYEEIINAGFSTARFDYQRVSSWILM